MRITQLGLTNWRNISGAELETDSPFVIVGGENASGKTTLLESIHLLLAGRSFRTREWSKVISHQANQGLVTAKIGEDFLGVSRVRGELAQQRLNGSDAQVSDIARKFPIQLFDNNLFDLFEGPPKYRRQLLDWGLFHVKQDFFDIWRRYRHALKQRNALLRDQRSTVPSELDAWDLELALAGQRLSEMRAEYAAELLDGCVASKLLKDIEISFSYFQGWPGEDSLLNALRHSRAKDLQYKRTTMGPQHSDLKIRVSAKKAGDILSRGQKKLAGFAIKIEQVRMYNQQSDSKCLLLCDDFSAELDANNQKQILDQIEELGSQVFVTAIEAATIVSMLKNPEHAKVFHVKQGQFS